MNLSEGVYLLTSHRQKAARGVGTLLFSALARMGADLAERLTRAREMRELHRFTDRELWDIGLSRSDIPSVEQGTYRRD
jgi:uncharacterized protein YjiS (DUF1127 family)